MAKYFIEHSAKGSTWKKHKYIRKEGNTYIYGPRKEVGSENRFKGTKPSAFKRKTTGQALGKNIPERLSAVSNAKSQNPTSSKGLGKNAGSRLNKISSSKAQNPRKASGIGKNVSTRLSKVSNRNKNAALNDTLNRVKALGEKRKRSAAIKSATGKSTLSTPMQAMRRKEMPKTGATADYLAKKNEKRVTSNEGSSIKKKTSNPIISTTINRIASKTARPGTNANQKRASAAKTKIQNRYDKKQKSKKQRGAARKTQVAYDRYKRTLK